MRRERRLLLMPALLLACIGEPEPPPERAVEVAALLPFTGDGAASGGNLEKALLMARDRINEAGGVAGRPLALVSRDTHSDVSRGLVATQQLLSDNKVLAILGPESENLAKLMVPDCQSADMLLLSPGITSPLVSAFIDKGYWFRFSPSGLTLGRALAARLLADGVSRVGILSVLDEYGSAFGGVVAKEFEQGGGTMRATVRFKEGQAGYGAELSAVFAGAPEAVVLVAYPKPGAAILREAIGTWQGRWYFAPMLRSEAFLQNAPPQTLESTVGVSESAAELDTFAAAFSQRWEGDTPMVRAAYYFDALAVLALAIEAAHREYGGVPPRDMVRDRLPLVAGPPGEPVRWDELARGLELVRSGVDIDYLGASGSMDFDAAHDVPALQPRFWTVQGGALVDLP